MRDSIRETSNSGSKYRSMYKYKYQNHIDIVGVVQSVSADWLRYSLKERFPPIESDCSEHLQDFRARPLNMAI